MPEMEHVAIMKKTLGLTRKILDGRKKIESRWYSVRCKPWNNIKKGETVYFKDSGEPVRIKTEVSRVVQFSKLTPDKVGGILEKYGENIGIGQERIHEFFERFKNKKYCILIFLKNPVEIKPFDIDKIGFGAMSAWLTINNVSEIKLNKKIRSRLRLQ